MASVMCLVFIMQEEDILEESMPMASVMCLVLQMQEEDILEHVHARVSFLHTLFNL